MTSVQRYAAGILLTIATAMLTVGLAGQPTDYEMEMRLRSAPVVVTVPEFPSVRILDHDGTPCDLPDPVEGRTNCLDVEDGATCTIGVDGREVNGTVHISTMSCVAD